jgi:CubicO group peptidase (beta-lactamase class C family)
MAWCGPAVRSGLWEAAVRSDNETIAIFGPLGMRDTGFVVAKDQRSRRAGLCGFDAEEQLTALTTVPGGHALAERPADMTFESGGQGLWSRLDDYLAFARLFLGGWGSRWCAPAARRNMRHVDLEPAHV